MSLPTFSELMASLQLTNTGEPETGSEDHPTGIETSSTPSSTSPSLSPSSPSPSPSPSPSSPAATRQHLPSNQDSPSIVISQFDPSHATRPSEQRGTKSLGRSNRFAPYLGATSNIQLRRSSLPDVPAEVPERDTPDRASSTSPRMRPNTLRDVSINATRPPRLRKVGNIETESDVPISSFVRRRTPQSSPTTSTFPHRSRRRSVSSQDSFSPVVLPTLLPGLTCPSPPHSIEPMEISELEDTSSSPPRELAVKPRSHHQGLRLSSYRARSQPHDGNTMPPLRSAA